MEQFPDGGHVRLRSRVRRKYLHAATDGIGVFLSPERASFNAAWRVHRVVRNGVPLVLLHGAAYGRYLAASEDPAPPDDRRRVVQGVYDDLEANDVMWTAVEAGDGDHHVVLLRHVSGRFLRANGRRKTCVTIDHRDNPSTMMHWEVETLKLRLEKPDILPPVPRVSSHFASVTDADHHLYSSIGIVFTAMRFYSWFDAFLAVSIGGALLRFRNGLFAYLELQYPDVDAPYPDVDAPF
ncbi:hypothetical protein HU200_010421 [Digitaria exilis]|uniref:DUF569 domain-containing protein n=1 Tax=Digitaria exilis TaxID=1010633 RepID=A0A835KNP0_9POAL|nr:hypothetical protein HU200_010421 [Digitaria exilis]